MEESSERAQAARRLVAYQEMANLQIKEALATLMSVSYIIKDEETAISDSSSSRITFREDFTVADKRDSEKLFQ